MVISKIKKKMLYLFFTNYLSRFGPWNPFMVCNGQNKVPLNFNLLTKLFYFVNCVFLQCAE